MAETSPQSDFLRLKGVLVYNMFLDVVSTHTKCIMNDFALAPRTSLFNFKCHTVTNGTDLRKSPHRCLCYLGRRSVHLQSLITHSLTDRGFRRWYCMQKLSLVIFDFSFFSTPKFWKNHPVDHQMWWKAERKWWQYAPDTADCAPRTTFSISHQDPRISSEQFAFLSQGQHLSWVILPIRHILRWHITIWH